MPIANYLNMYPSNSLLNNLSLLKDKVNQAQSLVNILISQDQTLQPESTSLAIASIGSILQEIIVAASSLMFTCQQLIPSRPNLTDELPLQPNFCGTSNQIESTEKYDWYGDNYNSEVMNVASINNDNNVVISSYNNEKSKEDYEIIELDADHLLAKYTHYCKVCGKGFKRDANLRMHMRAHGDEYKTNAALSNPTKNNISKNSNNHSEKYSCPQEGCRWNKKHAKFQPLKSMICVKNHYKRSHCPKMYVCKRCNRKHFSVLSDLRTHEKHCGIQKWQCSCGTTFSRKDKLLGHVALFIGHTPAVSSVFGKSEICGESSNPMQLEDRG